MRVTQSMFYSNIYSNNNQKLTKDLFDVNRQIASGLKIQYASEDVSTFTNTMRLDNEVTVLGQIQKSTESGYKVANQTDVTLNEFDTSMTRIRTLLVQADNGTNDDVSLEAISKELRGIESNLTSLANTSINGQYLFSGSAVGQKPIDDNGIYQGNDVAMSSFLGSNNQQQYNLSGAELFLGEEPSVKRKITTNVTNSNLIAQYSSLQNSGEPQDTESLSSSSTIRNLMGDTDNNIDATNAKHFFYIRGTTSSGESFKDKVSYKDTDKVSDLLDHIGTLYGNVGNTDVVDVTMNDSGEIIVSDKMRGSSKLDFQMVGAVDFSGGSAADQTSIDALDGGETDFAEIINPTTPPAKDLFVKEFSRSGLDPVNGTTSNIEGLLYDRTSFEKSGPRLSSNVAQIIKGSHLVSDNGGAVVDTISDADKNAFATPQTLISEVADTKTEITPSTTPKTYTLDGTVLKLKGVDINNNSFDVSINLDSTGSTFTSGGVSYDIYDMDPTGRKKVPADEMTYQQLMDVMNMVTTDSLPAANFADAQEYDDTIKAASFLGNTDLSYDGKIGFHDINNPSTKAEISLYDANSDDFTKDASVMTFNSNNALTISDAKTDFFKTLDDIISSVEEYKQNPNANSGNERTIGIGNSIEAMDGLMDHVSRSHATVGAYSNTLTKSLERTSMLDISTKSLRSSVIDTDLAEAALTLTQLTTNYEALLSSVGKVSQLSLVNYL